MVDRREVRATAVGAAVVGCYTILVLASGRVDPGQFSIMFLSYVGASIGLWIGVGVVGMFVQLFRNARSSGDQPFLARFARDAAAGRWQRDRGVSLIWPPLLFGSLMASFNSFKQMILPLAGYRFDDAFAAADRLLFVGTEGWRVTHALFGSPAATLAIDRLYHGWFAPVALGVIICAWLPASTYRLRTQYLFSYIAVWVGLGSVLAFLLPAAGPCFYPQLVGSNPDFQQLLNRLSAIQSASGTPLLALHNQQVLWHAHTHDSLAFGGGISAMPSVHNGLAILFALAAWKIKPVLGSIFGAYAALIWLGSIHLGWHYAVDGIVAGALTWWIWRACGKLADRLERPLFQKSVEPALA
jgi:hypothetical protein